MTARRIFVTADPELPVPPRLYGGIERVIALLVEGLSARGHDVTLFAHPDSRVSCRLVPYAGRSSAIRRDTLKNSASLAREVMRRRPAIIQSFSRLVYLLPLLPLPIPKVMSYQRVVTPKAVETALRLSRGTLSFTGCSQSLVSSVRSFGMWQVIHNAVPIDRYRYGAAVAPDAPMVFLGRVERIKGPHLAIEIARRTGRRLVLAGNVPDDIAHRQFFDQEIRPYIDGTLVTFIGPVNDAEKSRLLSSASVLLMPILWEEPFGIVMAEALACGTPVVGLARGALPEVIRDGRTGFVCQDLAGMIAAVERVRALDRAECRADAEARFSPRALVDAYERLYEDRLTRPRARAFSRAVAG